MRLRPPPKKPDALAKLLAQPQYHQIPIAIVPHGQVIPLGVMVRGTMEWLLDGAVLEQLFQQHAPELYTRDLAIDTMVKLLIQVSAGVRASVFAAFKADKALDEPSITTTFQALYGKLRLFEKTRDGERTLAMLTNLPDTATALQIAEIYRTRWTIETHFQFLTESLHCEVPSLGKPRAALLMFAMALVAGNALAQLRGALRQALGSTAAAEVSGYYLADEIAGDYRTVMKYFPADQWFGWRTLEPVELGKLLTALAAHVCLEALTRNQRGPKKPRNPKPVYHKQHKHYSTARLLKEQSDTC